MSQHLSASFTFEVSEGASEFWYDDLEEILPRRYLSGNAGALALFTYSMFAQTLEQVYRDVLIGRALKYNLTAEEGLLGLIGAESGMFQYNAETNASFRNRLVNRWNTWRLFGTPQSVINELNNASFTSASIYYELVGSDEEKPALKGGSTYNIPPYSSSQDHYAQFNVNIDVTNKTIVTGTLSNLVSDDALSDIRQIISKYKDVQWVCREIVITSGSQVKWGDEGLKFGAFTYADSEATVERHKGKI